MISLPPGCKVGYEIRFVVNELTDEMGEWFNLIGGKSYILEVPGRREYKFIPHVQYGRAKPSYKMQDGTNQFLIRFHGDDASAASMFLIKFLDKISNHNFNEYKDYVY
jgi:hypothetical protein